MLVKQKNLTAGRQMNQSTKQRALCVRNTFAFAEEGECLDEQLLDFGGGKVLEIGTSTLCFAR